MRLIERFIILTAHALAWACRMLAKLRKQR